MTLGLVVGVAAFAALACVAASARRVFFVYTATALDPALVVTALRGDAGRARAPRLAARMATAPPSWEHDLVSAFRADEPARAAEINEQLAEIDWRLQRWARVPRVCASIASSVGFLCAAMVLRAALREAPANADDFMPIVNAALNDALGAVSIGIAGATYCVVLHVHASKAARVRQQAIDELVERLDDTLSGSAGPPYASSSA